MGCIHILNTSMTIYFNTDGIFVEGQYYVPLVTLKLSSYQWLRMKNYLRQN